MQFPVALLLVLGVLSPSQVGAADKNFLSTHCNASENVIFSCPLVNKKTVSICASADLSNGSGTLQYRYGKLKKPLELSFPKEKVHPGSSFVFDSSHGGRWAQYDLRFISQGFEYVILVQTNSEIADNQAVLMIFQEHRRIKETECRFPELINRMWMLEDLNIPKKQR